LALFSGLGIDHGLYAPQHDVEGVRIELVPWLEVDEGETLQSYARRLASTINPDGALYLGGVSFGAMLALEAATVLRPRAVFNIAGAHRGSAVSPLVKITCLLARRMSDSMVRTAMAGAGLLIRMTGRPDRAEREFLLGLADRAIPWLTRWGCGAMLTWRAPEDLCCPVHHIHGSRDHLIPLQNVRQHVDVIVPGGGHVINVTHAAIVNRFIAERIER
jgi:pimeloyl-ACP methyl ester carboxylesterase